MGVLCIYVFECVCEREGDDDGDGMHVTYAIL